VGVHTVLPCRCLVEAAVSVPGSLPRLPCWCPSGAANAGWLVYPHGVRGGSSSHHREVGWIGRHAAAVSMSGYQSKGA
jgi:hypothetical protein